MPTLTPDGDPAEQNAALSAALGRDIPAGFGQLVVYRGEAVSDAQESVQSAQQLLAAAKRALWLIAILVVVLTAAAILIAPRRWRAVLVLSVGTAAALVVLRGATRQAVDEAQDLAPRPGGKAAIEAILGGASQSLLRVFGIVLLIALVATVVALFALRWRRQDLVLVGAVALGAAVVAAGRGEHLVAADRRRRRHRRRRRRQPVVVELAAAARWRPRHPTRRPPSPPPADPRPRRMEARTR